MTLTATIATATLPVATATTVLLGPEGQYFYFLFSNYAGPLEEQGIA